MQIEGSVEVESKGGRRKVAFVFSIRR